MKGFDKMTDVVIGGDSYRIFLFISIHEEDEYIECRNLVSGVPQEIVCEVRLTDTGESFLLPTSREINLELLRAVLKYLDDLDR